MLCDDLDLPAASFVPAVVSAIRQQIKQFDSDSEITLDQQTDQRVTIKVKLYLYAYMLKDCLVKRSKHHCYFLSMELSILRLSCLIIYFTLQIITYG